MVLHGNSIFPVVRHSEECLAAGGNYGLPFEAHRGVTQGGSLSSLMFYVCVDCVVREWLQQVLGEDIAQDGVGNLVRNQCIAFFMDDGLVAAR